MTATDPRVGSERARWRHSADRPLRIVERNLVVARQTWVSQLGGLLEPFLFLFSIGVGVGALVDGVQGPGGVEIPYRTFVAPALLASAAMNTAVFQSTIEFFARIKWLNTYDAMLATPITVGDVLAGEMSWILLRVFVNAGAFTLTMAAMGLLESWWAVLLVPVAVLVGFAFAGLGFLAASVMRTWLDFDFVFLATVPLFLFSASFFPLEQYPEGVGWVVRFTPLYHGVRLCRDLALGSVGWSALVAVAYLGLMGAGALAVAQIRLRRVLQP